MIHCVALAYTHHNHTRPLVRDVFSTLAALAVHVLAVRPLLGLLNALRRRILVALALRRPEFREAHHLRHEIWS